MITGKTTMLFSQNWDDMVIDC